MAIKQEIARKKRDIEALLENAPDMCEEVCELDELLISLFDLNLMSVIGMYYYTLYMYFQQTLLIN